MHHTTTSTSNRFRMDWFSIKINIAINDGKRSTRPYKRWLRCAPFADDRTIRSERFDTQNMYWHLILYYYNVLDIMMMAGAFCHRRMNDTLHGVQLKPARTHFTSTKPLEAIHINDTWLIYWPSYIATMGQRRRVSIQPPGDLCRMRANPPETVRPFLIWLSEWWWLCVTLCRTNAKRTRFRVFCERERRTLDTTVVWIVFNVPSIDAFNARVRCTPVVRINRHQSTIDIVKRARQ